MMKNILLLTTLMTLFLAGCRSAEQQNKIDESSPVEATLNDNSDLSSKIAAIEIQNDNGNKWLVNEEMKPYVDEAEKLVNQFSGSSLEDFNKLGKELGDQNTALIKSCTMDGKSHDELHKWLHPHLELTGKLAEATSLSDANELVSELKDSFRIYHSFFN